MSRITAGRYLIIDPKKPGDLGKRPLIECGIFLFKIISKYCHIKNTEFWGRLLSSLRIKYQYVSM